MKQYGVVIGNNLGDDRVIPLDHLYNTEEEAQSEAEDVADQEFTEFDCDWSLMEIK